MIFLGDRRSIFDRVLRLSPSPSSKIQRSFTSSFRFELTISDDQAPVQPAENKEKQSSRARFASLMLSERCYRLRGV